ncbi:MAG: hypothetical protein JJT76_19570 [Clostridiaceae bacterium]|nr:hypothetical protein [Clostridiaceae bacterium]
MKKQKNIKAIKLFLIYVVLATLSRFIGGAFSIDAFGYNLFTDKFNLRLFSISLFRSLIVFWIAHFLSRSNEKKKAIEVE